MFVFAPSTRNSKCFYLVARKVFQTWTTNRILQKKKKEQFFFGVEVEQETSAPPPKKNPGSAPEI